MRVGIAGFGFMGRMHYGCWKQVPGVEVVALCDRDQRQFDSSQAAAGNVAGADTSCDFGSAVLYDDYEKMLANANLDVVDITLPTFLHLPMTQQALAQGIHVLCEKPMALNAEECETMLSAWAAAPQNTELMIGQSLRFQPNYVFARELILSGKYGKVIAADFGRFSAAPGWSQDSGDNWFFDEKRSGGVALDLHIHDTDMVNFLFGMPVSVTSSAQYNGKVMQHISTIYNYDNMVVTGAASWAMAKSFGFERHFRIMFEQATLIMANNRTPEFMLYPMEGEPYTPELVTANPYQSEINWFVDKINGKAVELVTTPEQSRNSVRIVDAEKLSANSGQQVDL